MAMSGRRVVVLVIDRLGAAWRGPYGNTWLDTPNFNRLATESVLFETVLADSPDLAATCRSLWAGQHAMALPNASSQTVPAISTSRDGRSILLTDDEAVAGHTLASSFSEVRLAPLPELATSAKDIEQTGLFSFFAAAADLLRESPSSELTWIHSRGMSGPWDAPLELRQQFTEEDDPEPPNFIAPPNEFLPEGFDPDQLLGFVHAYAGQVALADMCLSMLMAALDEHSPKDQTMFVMVSPRGFPLGEHHRVGPCDEALYGELLQVPLLMRMPGGAEALSRVSRIVQPHELSGLLANETPDVLASGFNSSASVAYSLGPRQRAIRTPAWFMRECEEADGVRRELFAKPDDRWEANEVASRCNDVVELLAAELDRFAASGARTPAESPPLPEVLVDVWR